jgi:hypothetical protein
MRHASVVLAGIALVLASLACGTEPQAQAHTNKFVTVLALTQVEADLGKGAVVVRPIDTNTDDQACEVNGFSFSNCTVANESPPELHVQSTLCELKPDQPTETRFFIECRPAAEGVMPPAEIPHCPGHGSHF